MSSSPIAAGESPPIAWNRVTAPALRLTLVYVLCGVAWISLSDRILGWLVHDPAQLARIAEYKGWGFVGITGALLFVMLRWLLCRVQRERAETEHSEERLRHTFEQAAVGMAHVAPDGRFLRINRKLCEILGQAPEALLGKTFQEITHPDDLEADLTRAHRLLDGTGSAFSMRKRYLRPDRTVVWANLSVALVRGKDGEPDYFVSVVQDISEQKRAEDALRESEAKFRILVEQSITGVYLVVDGQFAYVNRKLAEMYGYTPEELIGRKRMLDLVAEQDRELVEEQIRKRLFGEISSAHYPVRGLRRDGSIIHVEVHGRFFVYEGRPALMGTLLDITDRKRSDETLRQTEARYRMLVAGTRDYALFMLDPKGHVATWNDGAAVLHGYATREILGEPLSRFYPSDESQEPRPEVLLARAEDQGRVEAEGWRVRKDGSRYWAEVVLTALRDGQGALIGFAYLTRDLTQPRDALRGLHDSRERLRALAARQLVAPPEERDRIAQQVHDELGRMLSAMNLELRWIEQHLAPPAPEWTPTRPS